MKQTLRCPKCGYTFTRDDHPSIVYCGPHGDTAETLTPAVPMYTITSGTKSGRFTSERSAKVTDS